MLDLTQVCARQSRQPDSIDDGKRASAYQILHIEISREAGTTFGTAERGCCAQMMRQPTSSFALTCAFYNLSVMALITGNSSLEPLFEGLLAQIQIELS